jgi:hypothetical protein
MGTNFLSLPSGGFTVLKPKQQTAPSQGFLPCIYCIPGKSIIQGAFLKKISGLLAKSAAPFHCTMCKPFTFFMHAKAQKSQEFPTILC